MANVLIVEDESIVAMDLKTRLEKLGHHILATCANGETAVRLAREMDPDLVLMDIVIKGNIDGIEAAERIRSVRPTPILYLTAHADARTLERAKATQPLGYVLKPFSDRDLTVTVNMAIHYATGEAERRRALVNEASDRFASLHRKPDSDPLLFHRARAEFKQGRELRDAVARGLEGTAGELREAIDVVGRSDAQTATLLSSLEERIQDAADRCWALAARERGYVLLTQGWVESMREDLRRWSEDRSRAIAFDAAANPDDLLDFAQRYRVYEFVLFALVLISESVADAPLLVQLRRESQTLVVRIEASRAVPDLDLWPGKAPILLRQQVAELDGRLELHGFPAAAAVELRLVAAASFAELSPRRGR